MLMCDECLTLVQHVREPNNDIYRKTIIEDASWYSKVKVELKDKGLVSANMVKVRIPEENMPEGVRIQTGDFLVRGNIHDDIAKPSDIVQYEHIKIMSVGNNCRGRLRHWVVVGS